jgi:hypothetical protein
MKNKKKIVFVSHPIGGDVVSNLIDLQEVIREINMKEPDVVPVASYYADVMALDDTNPEERKRGLSNSIELISRGMFDEVRLYGNGISPGMWSEIKAAWKIGTEVNAMTVGTIKDYEENAKNQN